MKTLTVHTPTQSYPIYIDGLLRSGFGQMAKDFIQHDAVIVTNDVVASFYLSQIEAALKQAGVAHSVIVLPDGEANKTTEQLNVIYDALMKAHAERSTTLIALGGGVIGDITGFAAATYQRGMNYIQFPTTLLSQVDSSVGGKTAVNHPLGKNMIGAFYQPKAVFADLGALSTLPAREFFAGMAEVIKYAVLGDESFLAWLEANLDAILAMNLEHLEQMVYRCCAMKADIVSKDEKEHAQRALLNLGHTFGHAIEAQMGYGRWLHGEAVAVGMVLACRLSEELGTLKASDTERVVTLLKRAQLPTDPPVFSWQAWREHLLHDKKMQSGQMRFITLTGLGRADVTPVNEAAIKAVLNPWLE